MKLKPEHAQVLQASGVKPAERRLLQILIENESIRADLLTELEDSGAHKGAGLEAVFEQALALAKSGEPLTVEALAERVGERERRLLYELAFEASPEPTSRSFGTLEEARSCLAALLRRKLEGELRGVQSDIQKAEQAKNNQELKELLARKQALRKALADLGG